MSTSALFHSQGSQAGLTLVEFLATTAVAAILASFAMPAFQQMITNNQILSQTNELATSFYLARSESAKRGHKVTICASTADQSNCDSDADNYSNGWLVYTDYNDNGVIDPAGTTFDTDHDGSLDSPEQILHVSQQPAAYFHIVSSRSGSTENHVSYMPDGQLDKRVLFSLELIDQRNDKLLSKVSFNLTGRSRACVVRPDRDC